MIRAQQLPLFAEPEPAPLEFVRGHPVERSGIARYIHIIRGANDPERSPRPLGGQPDRAPHRTLEEVPTEDCAAMIVRLLGDGTARTFNAIAVELLDQTADLVLDSPLDRALWQLVAEGRLEHTLLAPILFRPVCE